MGRVTISSVQSQRNDYETRRSGRVPSDVICTGELSAEECRNWFSFLGV